MPRRKRLTGKELIRALKKAGFEVIRVQGSHHRLRHADGRVTTVPVHAGDTIGPGLLAHRFSAIAISRTNNSKRFPEGIVRNHCFSERCVGLGRPHD